MSPNRWRLELDSYLVKKIWEEDEDVYLVHGETNRKLWYHHEDK